MKVVKYLMVAALAMFLVSCSGGSSEKVFDECVTKTVAKAKSQVPGGNIPAEAEKMLKTSAETGCQICKSDPKGAPCKTYLEALK